MNKRKFLRSSKHRMLKPNNRCPKCGSVNTDIVFSDDDNFWIKCNNCGLDEEPGDDECMEDYLRRMGVL
jgi:ribosomal protein S27E